MERAREKGTHIIVLERGVVRPNILAAKLQSGMRENGADPAQWHVLSVSDGGCTIRRITAEEAAVAAWSATRAAEAMPDPLSEAHL